MVKITKSGYSPIIDSSSKGSSESRIDQAVNQASGLVDATLRNVNATQNQAARDRVNADELAFRTKTGLSDLYFSTQREYLRATNTLFDIDVQNQKNAEKQLADSFNLAAKEKISLATAQFYADAKEKRPDTLLEDTQAFINSQIEKAVKLAPNDRAVLDLNAAMTEFKISQLGTAVEDRQKFRNNQITAEIVQAQQIGSSAIRLDPSLKMFNKQLNNFTQISDILSAQGYSKSQIDGLKSKYLEEMSASLVDGFLDKGDIDSVSELFSNREFVNSLGNKFDQKIDESRKRAEEVQKLRLEQGKEAAILTMYHSGKSPASIKGANEIIYADNLRFLENVESNINTNGVANSITATVEYIKQKPEFLPPETIKYMSNAVLGSTDKSKAAVYAGAVRQLVNQADTAHLFRNLDKDTLAQLAIISQSIYEGTDIDKAVIDVRDSYGKINKLGGNEEAAKFISTALTDKFGKTDSLTIGKKIWNDLEDSRYTMPLWRRIGEQLNYITPPESQLIELGQLYTETFNREFVNTVGDAKKAEVAAMTVVKASQAVTTVNGKLEIMLKSPEQLGILDTEEGKSYFDYELNKTKSDLAGKLGGTLVKGKVRIGNEEKEINIAPIPFRTGFEEDDTVRYLFVDSNQSPIRVNGREQYLTLDKRTYMKVIEDRALAELKVEQAILDNTNKLFENAKRGYEQKYGKK